jgi:acetyl esterase/lipase
MGRRISWQARCAEFLLRLVVRRKTVSGIELVGLRNQFAVADRRWFRIPQDVRLTDVDAGGTAAQWVDTPDCETRRVILYLHGGGFAVHLPSLYAGFTARLGRELKARVLMVDYRLAPEYPFPAAVDDCHAAYRWLIGQGFTASDIVIAGDSAGGNLTLVTLLRIKAAGHPMPACAVAISPGVDLTLSSPSIVENENSDALLRIATVLQLLGAYVGPEMRLAPLVSPLFGDLNGLPPLLLQAGTREILSDDAARFGAAARAAGVTAEVELWHGMQHCFQLLKFLPESIHALEAITAFVNRHTGWNPCEELPPCKS